MIDVELRACGVESLQMPVLPISLANARVLSPTELLVVQAYYKACEAYYAARAGRTVDIEPSDSSICSSDEFDCSMASVSPVSSVSKADEIIGAQPDYCYLQLFQDSCKPMVKVYLGPYPTFQSLLSLPIELFDLNQLDKWYLTKVSDGVYHLRSEGLVQFSHALSAMLVSSGQVWPRGSLGRMELKDLHLVPEDVLSKPLMLNHFCGSARGLSDFDCDEFPAYWYIQFLRQEAVWTVTTVLGSNPTIDLIRKLPVELLNFEGNSPIFLPIGSAKYDASVGLDVDGYCWEKLFQKVEVAGSQANLPLSKLMQMSSVGLKQFEHLNKLGYHLDEFDHLSILDSGGGAMDYLASACRNHSNLIDWDTVSGVLYLWDLLYSFPLQTDYKFQRIVVGGVGDDYQISSLTKFVGAIKNSGDKDFLGAVAELTDDQRVKLDGHLNVVWKAAALHDSEGKRSLKMLEAVGDAALTLVLSEFMYETATVQAYQERRSQVTNNSYLCEMFVKSSFVVNLSSVGAITPRIGANATEALIGACFVSGGLQLARALILNMKLV